MSLERNGSIFFFFLLFFSFSSAVGLWPRSQREKEKERGMNVVGKLFGELINSLRDWKKRYYKGRGSSGVWKFFF